MATARALTAVVACSLALALQPSPATRLKTLCEERRRARRRRRRSRCPAYTER